jgi:hypothetical protein
MYSVRYYPRFHVSVVDLGTYYLWKRGHYYVCIYMCVCAFVGTVNNSIPRIIIAWRVAREPAHNKVCGAYQEVVRTLIPYQWRTRGGGGVLFSTPLEIPKF